MEEITREAVKRDSESAWRLRFLAADTSGIVFPEQCLVCGTPVTASSRDICDACMPRLPVFDRPICVACRKFADVHGRCCEVVGFDPIPRLWALAYHDDCASRLVDAIKNHNRRDLATRLGVLLGRFIQRAVAPDTWDLVTCVPMARHKYRRRRFNPAEAIASGIVETARWNLQPNLLQLVRKIKDQKTLTAKQRHANVRGAFAATDAEPMHDRSVLLIDDVTTTGATLEDCARALASGGAKRVDMATIAMGMGSPA